MKYLELTFHDPETNLACDEALLEFFEETHRGQLLRIWKPDNYFVVLGYSNRLSSEVNCTFCEANGIPILRRFSGGGAVLQGPGCLNYSLVFDHQAASIKRVEESFSFVLRRHRNCLERLNIPGVAIQGVSDLSLAGRKFSGNAQHRKRRYTLLHGTFLLDFDIPLIEKCLLLPSKQPAYRQNRSHETFLCNLEVDVDAVSRALRGEWKASQEFRQVPHLRIEELVRTRYSQREWVSKF